MALISSSEKNKNAIENMKYSEYVRSMQAILIEL